MFLKFSAKKFQFFFQKYIDGVVGFQFTKKLEAGNHLYTSSYHSNCSLFIGSHLWTIIFWTPLWCHRLQSSKFALVLFLGLSPIVANGSKFIFLYANFIILGNYQRHFYSYKWFTVKSKIYHPIFTNPVSSKNLKVYWPDNYRMIKNVRPSWATTKMFQLDHFKGDLLAFFFQVRTWYNKPQLSLWEFNSVQQDVGSWSTDKPTTDVLVGVWTKWLWVSCIAIHSVGTWVCCFKRGNGNARVAYICALSVSHLVICFCT